MDGGTVDGQMVNKFGAVEYVVFSTVLVLSAAIGVFYGCFGSAQKTTEEFLMANRQMSILPVALSILCSFISAITLLGNPAEIYLYGTQYGMILIAFVPITLALIFFYVPVFFNLQVSSAYEYLEMRFNRKVRIAVSLLSIHYVIVYMALVVYGPSLALEQVTGIKTRVSTAAIFIVCIFYSSIGGLRAVLITDALQAFIMLASMAVVVIKGISDVGGLSMVFARAQESGRVEFFNFDPDPRTRHTFWTATVGGFLMWLPVFATSQQQVQRYLSLRSMASVQRALMINLLGFVTITILWFLAGLALYAKYFDCDPVKSKIVDSSDQLLPQFVMDTSKGIPGLAGFFVAGVTCASLSSVSSGLNALASVFIFDYVKRLAPNLTDERLSFLSKVASVFFGAISFGCIFIVENMEGLMPAANTTLGMIDGPMLGIFTLGMMFPWSNSKGVILGSITTFVILILQAVGVYMANTSKMLPDQTLFLSTEGCPANLTVPTSYFPKDWKNNGDGLLIQFLSMSFNWQSGFSFLLTVTFGLLFSALVLLFEDNKTVRSDLLSPPVLALWNKLFPGHYRNYYKNLQPL